MSDGDPFSYRVKFKDIRIKPPKDEASRARAQKTRVCDHKQCDLEGTHPAPKRQGNGRHYFCQAHAAEYNRSFDFFEGMFIKLIREIYLIRLKYIKRTL